MIYLFFTVCSFASLNCEAYLTETKYKTLETCIMGIGPVIERKIEETPNKFIYAVCVEDLRRL